MLLAPCLRKSAINVPLDIAFLDRIALVKLLLALRQPYFTFGMSAFRKINAVGDYRQAFFVDTTGELLKFGFVEQQLPGPLGFMLGHAGVLIFIDMEILEVELSMLKHAPCITHIGLSKPQGFDLSAFQDDPGLILTDELVFMTRLTVEDFQWCIELRSQN